MESISYHSSPMSCYLHSTIYFTLLLNIKKNFGIFTLTIYIFQKNHTKISNKQYLSISKHRIEWIIIINSCFLVSEKLLIAVTKKFCPLDQNILVEHIFQQCSIILFHQWSMILQVAFHYLCSSVFPSILVQLSNLLIRCTNKYYPH